METHQVPKQKWVGKETVVLQHKEMILSCYIKCSYEICSYMDGYRKYNTGGKWVKGDSCTYFEGLKKRQYVINIQRQ